MAAEAEADSSVNWKERLFGFAIIVGVGGRGAPIRNDIRMYRGAFGNPSSGEYSRKAAKRSPGVKPAGLAVNVRSTGVKPVLGVTVSHGAAGAPPWRGDSV